MTQQTEFTTRVFKYGAVPLGPFPKEGMDELARANRLWNKLVEIHNQHSDYYEQARRPQIDKNDSGYLQPLDRR